MRGLISLYGRLWHVALGLLDWSCLCLNLVLDGLRKLIKATAEINDSSLIADIFLLDKIVRRLKVRLVCCLGYVLLIRVGYFRDVYWCRIMG